MKTPETKILSREAMKAEAARLREAGKKIAFTNGCFDILHAGHVSYLAWARQQGDVLVIGLNSDKSVRQIKGPKRPVVHQDDRAKVLAALEAVDYVVLFDEDEPIALISDLLPDVLVKGEDWAHYVSGREVVEKHGGRVALAPLVEGKSTSDLIQKILHVYGDEE
ncbi:MAG: D-glycero-beta-D-manno-heptose 1-phosphate adenylyltransferase [Kiritimatiellae bacterium]|nr:D-glycero-beta-D-manno-heptose 1-phosphate adenylyltransferase [Kiritimatiellia bacterium]